MNEIFVDAGVDALLVRELQREQRERRGDDDLADDLGPAAEAEALLLAGLQEVVDEADEPEPHHHEQHEQPRGGRALVAEQQRRAK